MHTWDRQCTGGRGLPGPAPFPAGPGGTARSRPHIALRADNLDIGRPGNMDMIFSRPVRTDTKGAFRTAVGRNDGVVSSACRRHSRVKAYSKNRALAG